MSNDQAKGNQKNQQANQAERPNGATDERSQSVRGDDRSESGRGDDRSQSGPGAATGKGDRAQDPLQSGGEQGQQPGQRRETERGLGNQDARKDSVRSDKG